MSTDVIAADARYRKAINLAANAEQIVAIPGEQAFLVPAAEGGYYRVDAGRLPLPGRDVSGDALQAPDRDRDAADRGGGGGGERGAARAVTGRSGQDGRAPTLVRSWSCRRLSGGGRGRPGRPRSQRADAVVRFREREAVAWVIGGT